MINPYQAPAEMSLPPSSSSEAAAEFCLSGRDIRFAESKYLLFRCGSRLTLVSILMIVLTLSVTIDPLGIFARPGASSVPYGLSLMSRALVVMALATLLYQGLIRKVRKSVREQLRTEGIVDGAQITVSVADGNITSTGPAGPITYPLKKVYLIRSGRGLIIAHPGDAFWFVPKHAVFSVPKYRDFLRIVRRQATTQSLLGPN